MTKKLKINLTALICSIIFVIVLLFLMQSCGLDSSKEDKAQVVACDGQPAGTTRKASCDAGFEGEKLQVCSAAGAWDTISQDCRPVSPCGEDVVNFENDIAPIVQESCAACHGGYTAYETFKNAASEAIGGAGGQSQVLYYIKLPESDERHMPKGRPSLTPDKIQNIDDWIKAGFPKNAGECPTPGASIDLNYQEDVILRFLEDNVDPDDRRNYRFFTFAHKYNLKDSLAEPQKGFNEAINSLSFANDIFLCKPIESTGSVCAFNIDALDLTIQDFLLVENDNPLPIISRTSKGVQIQRLTGTRQPLFYFDAFELSTIANAQVYNKIMGFRDFLQALSLFGINYGDVLNRLDYNLIGTNESFISTARNTRLIAMVEGEVNGFETFCHISYDNPRSEGAQFDLFQFPFLSGSAKLFQFAASEIICGLPNRLHAYFLSNNVGVLQEFAPETIVFCRDNPDCIDPRIDTPVDCMNCHRDGYIPKVDVIRDHVVNSRNFNAQDVDLAKQVYLEPVRNQAKFNYHNSLYYEGLTKTGIQVGEPNYLLKGMNTLLQRQNLDQVAAILFSTPELIKECIESSQILSGGLGGLTEGAKVTFDTFVAFFGTLIDECEVFEDPDLPQ